MDADKTREVIGSYTFLDKEINVVLYGKDYWVDAAYSHKGRSISFMGGRIFWIVFEEYTPECFYAVLNKEKIPNGDSLEVLLIDREIYDMVQTWINS